MENENGNLGGFKVERISQGLGPDYSSALVTDS
jgi:hypothetical protein